jgi:serine O-acetyltransferase
MPNSASPEPSRAPALAELVEQLCADNQGVWRSLASRAVQPLLPSRNALHGLMEDLRSVLFPGYFGSSDVTAETVRYHVGATLARARRELGEQIRRGLCFVCREEDPAHCALCERHAARMADSFVTRLPEVRRLLLSDVRAAYEGDPAATSADETIFCYPGILAVTNQRVAHELYRLEVPLLPRMLTEQAHSVTGIDIHPGASIGERFFIDHGTGVVIGETSTIGNNVRLYQGVTLGAKSFPLDEHGNPIKGIPRHPNVEDDVVIYAGATVLGRITVGRGSVIGGNVWVTESVPAGSKLSQASAR